MEQKNVQIRLIKEKLRLILNELAAIKKDNEQLKAENARLINDLKEHDKKLEEFQNKDINLQLSRVLGKGVAGESGLRQRLDEYIGEIEATIAHLKD
jgi:septal ring factor EnvC (AmiA/AmiB activator)